MWEYQWPSGFLPGSLDPPVQGSDGHDVAPPDAEPRQAERKPEHALHELPTGPRAVSLGDRHGGLPAEGHHSAQALAYVPLGATHTPFYLSLSSDL